MVESDIGHNKAEDLELHFEQLLFYCYFNQFMGTENEKKNEFENQADETNLFGPNRSPMLVKAC